MLSLVPGLEIVLPSLMEPKLVCVAEQFKKKYFSNYILCVLFSTTFESNSFISNFLYYRVANLNFSERTFIIIIIIIIIII